MISLCRSGLRALRSALPAALALLASASPALAGGATLQWDANTEPELAGYKLHYGTASGSYTTHVDVKNVLTKAVTGLTDGTAYYFAVTAYDSVGNESGYSKEVKVVPGVETVSTPSAPSGPTSGTAGVAYTYTAAGAVSSSGDAVQYRFSWADGTDSGWLAAGVTSASKTWAAAGTYAQVRVEARCATHTSVASALSASLSVTIAAAATETVSAPSVPSGPKTGVVGTAYTYTTGGAVSSAGDAVQYRFSWADGTVSEWLPAGTTRATKTWAAAGTYTLVKAEARCTKHPTIVSAASAALTVVISAGASETVSAPTAPAGTTAGRLNTTYTFTSGGAASSTGDTIRYRFHWGDGTVSDWIAATGTVKATNSWSAAGTYQVEVEAACASHGTVSAYSAATAVTIAAASTDVASVLWTRSDTGQAALWELDPATHQLLHSTWIYSSSGVGKPWRATSYTRVDASTGYVLWSRSDSGRAALWKINPATGAILTASYIHSAAGIGAPWEATSYVHVDDTTGYVLWSRSDTGQAALWKVNPSVTRAIPVTASAYLHSASGVGAPWQATSYAHVDGKTGYVLWTRSDTGQAALWKVDPSVSGTIPIASAAYVHSASGIGSPWLASGYVHVDDTTGYVLWTRSDSGRGAVWKVNPSASGTIPISSSKYLYSASGIGSPWHATGYAR